MVIYLYGVLSLHSSTSPGSTQKSNQIKSANSNISQTRDRTKNQMETERETRRKKKQPQQQHYTHTVLNKIAQCEQEQPPRQQTMTTQLC